MVLCSVECVQRVSQYLRIPPGNLYMSENNILASDDILPNQCVEGFSAIVQALIMNSTSPARHLGSDTEKQALTRQWLEYAVLRINYADNALNSKRILRDLNDALKSSPYITGTEMTLADVVSYHLLHGIVKDLSQQEKAQYVNISRWFDNIQQDDEIRQKLQLVNFDLLNLYL
ncbi:eukaryotic translation elongation factor 1 epsilon-1 [Neodiprion pinetum]|uniref:Eukaryotic translation elongation factor 1 epsilon-1 n=1 Tax=Neodiprion lecontei TaxID=441921 RepID=A0A6J0B4E2_NEOLC|nr:eukaryotic translation elongation factor 1 epsilon-1 [Neodiprion lecontei]XP_046436055.1 eukaryotic translation elongation factor 1 epsilon-1 [Neodiprion fabricii]XP_046469727.1 eukaryotic translation elongation factor 1 epsilon-1 [Neodiprion pinetum]